MKLSTRSRYGLRLILDIAQHCKDGPVNLGAVSRRQDIPVKYLEQIITPLKKSSYVRSVRGPKGGHVLARDPADISVGQILGILEGGLMISKCTDDPGACRRSATCPTRHVWQEATEALLGKLNAISLSDLVKIATEKDIESEMENENCLDCDEQEKGNSKNVCRSGKPPRGPRT